MQADVLSIAVSGFIASAGLLALILAIRHVLNPTLVDAFRQDVFAIRRDMFMFMADGNIKPDHPAYVHLRNTMNGLLLYAGRGGIIRAVLMAVFRPRDVERHSNRTRMAIASIEDFETRKKMFEFHNRLSGAIVKWLLLGSITGWVCLSVLLGMLFVLTLVLSVFRRGDGRQRSPRPHSDTIFSSVEGKLKKPADGIEARAFEYLYDGSAAAA